MKYGYAKKEKLRKQALLFFQPNDYPNPFLLNKAVPTTDFITLATRNRKEKYQRTSISFLGFISSPDEMAAKKFFYLFRRSLAIFSLHHYHDFAFRLFLRKV